MEQIITTARDKQNLDRVKLYKDLLDEKNNEIDVHKDLIDRLKGSIELLIRENKKLKVDKK